MLNDRPFMVGVAARLPELSPRDYHLMKKAGIGWLRFGDFGFDLNAFLQGEPQPENFRRAKERVKELRDLGFELMGITPGPREMAKSPLEVGSERYFEAYDEISRFFAQEYEGLIEWWQVANELDIWIFRDTLNMEESVRFLQVGIRSMKAAVPSLRVGINITLFPSRPGEVEGNTDAHEGLALAEGIYGDSSCPVDYAGFDSYPGTWREGGPESWLEYLPKFYDLVGKPIIIQEFGYASAGGIMTEEEIERGCYPCECKRWKFSWKGEHSERVQAEYLVESFHTFRGLPYVLGATYYNWRDAESCWQCKESGCPAETAWGLINSRGEPKPSYESLRSLGYADADFLLEK